MPPPPPSSKKQSVAVEEHARVVVVVVEVFIRIFERRADVDVITAGMNDAPRRHAADVVMFCLCVVRAASARERSGACRSEEQEDVVCGHGKKEAGTTAVRAVASTRPLHARGTRPARRGILV